MLERHYTPKELAELWGISDDIVRAWFEREDGVLRIDRPETRNKRRYTTLRIPKVWRTAYISARLCVNVVRCSANRRSVKTCLW